MVRGDYDGEGRRSLLLRFPWRRGCWRRDTGKVLSRTQSACPIPRRNTCDTYGRYLRSGYIQVPGTRRGEDDSRLTSEISGCRACGLLLHVLTPSVKSFILLLPGYLHLIHVTAAAADDDGPRLERNHSPEDHPPHVRAPPSPAVGATTGRTRTGQVSRAEQRHRHPGEQTSGTPSALRLQAAAHRVPSDAPAAGPDVGYARSRLAVARNGSPPRPRCDR
ncbi:hypothetical protein GGS23DRAFT_549170 [Durotheca rogersii]|uniref:uncharacterized protein n=1 Tax=Durotheca rogersii TaxID=419775 RepID=UPI002220C101|nr:uncharacterized protein GGS23DRAFT_549170 [Durotheca rogersii]KAI5867611.1 hypothetical protein GGS23DRAFT_549170 [Durotheca rogersii]